MTLAPMIALRSVYTWKEVCGMLGMTRNQVRYLVRRSLLKKSGGSQYPFRQADVNEFLVRLNASEVM